MGKKTERAQKNGAKEKKIGKKGTEEQQKWTLEKIGGGENGKTTFLGFKLISLRECAAEQRTSSWLRARVAKGLRAAPLRQFRRQSGASYGKADEFQDQAYP